MIPQFSQSTDSGAPVLTGLAGSGIALLRSRLLAAGWTEPYTSANNIAVFRAASGCCIRVDDNATGTVAGREMRLRCYKTMTDLNTGTEETPMAAQNASGGIWYKSAAATATAVPWIVLATDRWCQLYTVLVAGQWCNHFAGHTQSARPGDESDFAITCGQFPDVTTAAHFGVRNMNYLINGAITAAASLSDGGNSNGYIMRAAGAAPGSVPIHFFNSFSGINAIVAVGNAGIAFPSPVSLLPIFSKLYFKDGVDRIRGTMPGILIPLHVRPFANNSSQVGPGGETLRALIVHANQPLATTLLGQLCLDLSTDA